MSIQTKKGFTLIELMVVIVIIGILAAIAIPKLFGMSAKAKASEVGPAAGTWSKLQMAYILEKGSFGSFDQVAYQPPASKNFEYGPGGQWCKTVNGEQECGKDNEDEQEDDIAPTLVGDNDKNVWRASPKVDLTDNCKSASGAQGERWRLEFADGDREPTKAKAYAPCSQLTPSFCNLLAPSGVCSTKET